MAVNVAIVTGGTSGIGRATAEALARGGYAVYALGRTAPMIDRSVPMPGSVVFRAADVRHAHTIRAVLEEAREVGDLAILVNAAGVITPGAIRETAAGSVSEQISVNLIGAITVSRLWLDAIDERSRQATRNFPERRPIVVFVASTSGMRPSPGWAAYGASKAALINFGQSLAQEDPGLNVITVAPGRTATRLRRAIAPLEDQSTIQQPEDVARVIVGLVADANGQPERSFVGSPIVCAKVAEASR